jgi:anaerobic selenocysteine-containing dehydrogenase
MKDDFIHVRGISLTTWKRSVCPYDCPDACGLLVETDGTNILQVKGDPEHPYTRGILCPKMNHYEKTVHLPDRITVPMLRTGKKGDGKFVRISWDEAISRITDKWKDLIEQFGAESILPYSFAGTFGLVHRNVGHAFFHRMGASRLDRTICSNAREAGWALTMGKSLSSNPLEAAKSDLIILWGTNTVATNIHFSRIVQDAKKNGAKVWLIETYKTAAATLADEVFVVRPGSDGALALGMMHVLVREGLIDKAFIDNYVQGFDELKETILPQYHPDHVSAITGLPASVIEAMAISYGKAKAPFIRTGTGMSRSGNGAMTYRTVACLPALVGAWTKDGGGCLVSCGTALIYALNEITREDFLSKPTRIINMNQLGSALTELPANPVKSLYVYHSNPAAITPNQAAVLKGLEREDLFTVVHDRFMTDTAKYADIFLPATSSVEQSDIFRAIGHYCIQYSQQVIPPIGESKSNWDTFCLLAKAMGYDEPYFSQSAEECINNVLKVPHPWRDQLTEAQREAYHAGTPVELPLPSKPPFKTASGKIEILNDDTEPLPRYLDMHGGSYPLKLVPAPSMYSLNSCFTERPELREKNGLMRIKINSADAAARGLKHGEQVIVYNDLAGVVFYAEITDDVPAGTVVAVGVYRLSDTPGGLTVNALFSERLTDKGKAATLSDNTVDVKRRDD